MNPLLFVASITSNRKIRRWCAIKRHKQWAAVWAAREKADAQTSAHNINIPSQI